MKRVRGFLFGALATLWMAAPAAAWGNLNDSEEPGSVLVFPKFITGAVLTPDQGFQGTSQFFINVSCPNNSLCTDFQTVSLRAHWVCPGDATKSICSETDFNLFTTINGTILIDANGVGAPSPPCPRGYLIVWATDVSGNPIKFDGLTGTAILRGSGTSFRSYNALPIQASESLTTGQSTDVNGDGSLVFNGTGYQAITGKIIGNVRYGSTVPNITTSLTLLTLDTASNRPNNPTFVDLNFYNETERLISTSTHFTCWEEVKLTDINSNLTRDVGFGAAGLVQSVDAVQSTGPVTLVGLVETTEGFTENVSTTITVEQCFVIFGQLVCFPVPRVVTIPVPLLRESANTLFNDSKPVATTFFPF